MLGFFQCCILPDRESRKQGALDCSSLEDASSSLSSVKRLGNLSLPSCESTDEEIFHDENEEEHHHQADTTNEEGDENRVPVHHHPQDPKKADPIQDFQKKSKESFRVVETDKNHILMSPTQVVVFRKPTTEMEEPKLLHIHQRAILMAHKKKKSRRTSDHTTKKQVNTDLVLSAKETQMLSDTRHFQ